MNYNDSSPLPDFSSDSEEGPECNDNICPDCGMPMGHMDSGVDDAMMLTHYTFDLTLKNFLWKSLVVFSGLALILGWIRYLWS